MRTDKNENTRKRNEINKNKLSSKNGSRKRANSSKKLIKNGNKQIILITYIFVIIMLGMTGYLVKFMVCDSQTKINNQYNKRQELLAQKTVRGKILSSDGKVLAKTVEGNNGEDVRKYPYGSLFAHVVGRVENSMTGIELSQCFPLLTSHTNPFKKLVNEFKGKKNKGDICVTTLDYKLQKAAYDALGSYKGAVVAIEPSTGKILAMVSKPDYDPNTVSQNWDTLVADSEEDSALLNRATQGLYPPGSTFKLLTAIEYMKENDDYGTYKYDCKGTANFNGYSIKCYGNEVHGSVNLKESLAESCNCSFANIGLGLNIDSFAKLCEKFRFNKSLSVDFEYNKSSFKLNKNSNTDEIIQTSIGQGKTTITPLENALIVSAIANKGKMMNPYVVDCMKSSSGNVVKKYSKKQIGNPIGKKISKKITRYMKEVVNSGTAHELSQLSYAVAGKTGTAEIDASGTSHAWFVGFAPASNPKIAVSIVVEGAGSGSQYAVPIAKKMFEEYLGY